MPSSKKTNFSFLKPTDSYPKARAAAIRALEIDDQMPEAHASLAWIKAQYDWDWTGAERKFKQAIELNPDYAPAHYWSGLFLSAMGRHDEAIAAGNRAKEIERLSLIPNTALGLILYFARQYPDAIEQLRRTVELEPNFSWVRGLLGDAYERQAMYPEALNEFKLALNTTGSRTLSLATLGRGFAISGDRPNALKVLAELQEIQKQDYVAPFFMALIYSALGESDQALASLETGFEGRSWGLLWLKVDPRLDSLRADPRFTDLLERMNFQGDN